MSNSIRLRTTEVSPLHSVTWHSCEAISKYYLLITAGPHWASPPQKEEYATVSVHEDALPDSLIFKLRATAGDGSDNITYSFEKQTPSRPLLFDLFDDEVRVAPDSNLDVDRRNIPTTYILHFR